MKRESLGIAVLLGTVLCAVVLLSYAGMEDHRFLRHWDDPDYVTDNPMVAQGLTWDGFRAVLVTPVQGNWQPLTLLSHMWDVERHGMDPAGHHRTSVWLHVANSLLFFLAMQLLFLASKSPPTTDSKKHTALILRCGLAAALFGLHPLHVESVAWVAERKDVLSGFWFFLVLCAYARYVASPTRWRYSAIVVALVLGLMSKSMLVTTPLVLLLLDIWPLRRIQLESRSPLQILSSMRPLLIEKLVLVVPVIAFSLIGLVTQQDANTVVSLDRLSALDRVTHAIAAYGIYLHKLAIPLKLSPFYPLPSLLEPASQVWQRIGVSAVFLAALLLLSWRLRDRAPYLLIGFLSFLIMLIPVIGLVQIGDQAWADRYMYLPMIGPIMAIVWSTFDWIGSSSLFRNRGAKGIAAIATLGLLLILGSLTAKQVQVWSSSERLWQHARRVDPHNFRASFNLAQLRIEDRDYRGALRYLRESETIVPTSLPVQRSLGLVSLRLGRIDDASRYLESSVAQLPRDAELHYSLGLIAIDRGQWRVAREAIKRAQRLEPENPRYRVNARGLLRR